MDRKTVVRLVGATRLRTRLAAARLDVGISDLVNQAINDYLDRNPIPTESNNNRGEQPENG